MIEMNNLVVYFNKGTPSQMQALKGLSLHLKKGQFTIVIGGNGAGKSTLLNSLSGEIKLDQGEIRIDGSDVTSWSTAKRASVIGRVFQDPMIGTCSDLSIEDNLSLACSRGQTRTLSCAIHKKERELFREALSKLNLGLENRLKDPIGLLSGGQRQAISLIMSTISPLKVLLLDEHTAALDPKTAAFILQLTKELIEEQQLTVMMVTHSLHQAIDFGDRLIMLSQGNVALDVEGDQKKSLHIEDLYQAFES
ncbi:MAG: thiQ [Chlamydiales bacterium]|jgi:putative ABC transport system ATP-binding protein|nr:thiQ [Chlamydiales bacterium]